MKVFMESAPIMPIQRQDKNSAPNEFVYARSTFIRNRVREPFAGVYL